MKKLLLILPLLVFTSCVVDMTSTAPINSATSPSATNQQVTARFIPSNRPDGFTGVTVYKKSQSSSNTHLLAIGSNFYEIPANEYVRDSIPPTALAACEVTPKGSYRPVTFYLVPSGDKAYLYERPRGQRSFSLVGSY